MVAPGPISASVALQASTAAPAPTTVSVSVLFGPMSAPVAMDVRPCSCVF